MTDETTTPPTTPTNPATPDQSLPGANRPGRDSPEAAGRQPRSSGCGPQQAGTRSGWSPTQSGFAQHATQYAATKKVIVIAQRRVNTGRVEPSHSLHFIGRTEAASW